MVSPDSARARHSLLLAIALSLLLHGLALLIPQQKPPESRPPARFEASLAPLPKAVPVDVPKKPESKPAVKQPKQVKQRRVLATSKPSPRAVSQPQWSVAEKQDIDNFLNELGEEAKRRPPPTLAQRSLAAAREAGRQVAAQDAAQTASFEWRPNAPPPNPFSIDAYIDGLLKRLNKSAAYVPNDHHRKGKHNAAIQFRLNPDGTLKSFVVLNAADQGAQIEYIKAIVERSAPFSPFPPDINRAARSLAMIICITPDQFGDGFGFARMPEGRGC